MVQEAHSRGMEFHAWCNPYRAVFRSNGRVDPDHITKRKPEWFFNYDGKKLFNPGISEARHYIVQVIMDVVRNYDVDGIHFDDYFYPYPARGDRSEEHTSELQSLMRISYAVFCLKKKKISN